jgi:hypothetical protein
MRYLDFENHEKGYEKFTLTKASAKANIGKAICFVSRGSIDKYRGYFRVSFGVISGVHYNTVLLNEHQDQIDIRDIVECGIKIPENAPKNDPT